MPPTPGWWQTLLERVKRWLPGPAGQPGPEPWGWYTGNASPDYYAALYARQPHVRTVVDFLASQLGQLGIHVYRRLEDNDRVRVARHGLARLCAAPNPGTTRYAWIRSLVSDIGVFGNHYSVKMRTPGRLELYRVHPGTMTPHGDLIPRAYTWTPPGQGKVLLAASEVFHVREYSPSSTNPLEGLSRLETLRALLSEQSSATLYRQAFWSNAARISGVIERPVGPRWTLEQQNSFRDQWQATYQGTGNAGKTVVLEDGMTFRPISATAEQSQLIESRQLTREEVAAAYHVPPAMIGMMGAVGYGSVRAQHAVLYQDVLGPYIAMLEAEIERQLLSDFSDSEGVYVSFNIKEKLQGSFEEEAGALATATGSPWLSRNEARARQDLRRVDDPTFDQPITRLDTAQGQEQKRAGEGAMTNGKGNGNG